MDFFFFFAIQIQIFCFQGHQQDREEIIHIKEKRSANPLHDKGLVSRIRKGLPQLNKKTHHPIKNGQQI